MDISKIKEMNLNELKEYAKKYKIRGYSTKNKDELIEYLITPVNEYVDQKNVLHTVFIDKSEHIRYIPTLKDLKYKEKYLVKRIDKVKSDLFSLKMDLKTIRKQLKSYEYLEKQKQK